MTYSTPHRTSTQAIIHPALGGRGDRKACAYFHWLRKSERSEWLHSCKDLLVTLTSHSASAGNPEGTGSRASLVGLSELAY